MSIKQFLLPFAIVLLLLALVFIACLVFGGIKSYPPKAASSVISNNVQLQTGGSLVYKDRAVVPLLKVLESFGIQITWENESDAILSYNNVRMTLSLNNKSLMDDGGWEWLAPLPGEKHHYCVIDGQEVFVNTTTVSSMLNAFGIRISVLSDYESANISIVHRQ